jgi:hypothetical protein
MFFGCLFYSYPKPDRCQFGHSLALGKPQKISWMPCICGPARERAEYGRAIGHLTLWCGMCSDQDHRDTVFYEPPHDLVPPGPQRLDDMTGRLSASDTTARATATAEDRSGASTVTVLMIFSHVCALITLAFLLDAARPAATVNWAGRDRSRHPWQR